MNKKEKCKIEENSFYSIRRKVIKWIYVILGIILWTILIVLLIYRLFNDSSGIEYYYNLIIKARDVIIRYLCKTYQIDVEIPFVEVVDIKMPLFIAAESIKEVAKTIGIVSILITWLYAKLNDTELGYKCVDLLRDEYRFFYIYTVSHCLSVLICIWASVPALEVAVISFIIILWSNIAHFLFLRNLIFSSSKRRELALKYLESNLKDSSNIDYLNHSYNFIDSCDWQHDYDIKVLSDEIGRIFLGVQDKNPLNTYYNLWERILNNQDPAKRSIIVNCILNSCNKLYENKKGINKDKYLAEVCVSYIYWLYLDAKEKLQGFDEKNELQVFDVKLFEKMIKVVDDIAIQNKNKLFVSFLQLFLGTLIWRLLFEPNERIDLLQLKMTESWNFECSTGFTRFECSTYEQYYEQCFIELEDAFNLNDDITQNRPSKYYNICQSQMFYNDSEDNK